ncbi:MAG: ComEC/Rec2 family competence protein, partial [Microthrixaceae bacterium]
RAARPGDRRVTDRSAVVLACIVAAAALVAAPVPAQLALLLAVCGAVAATLTRSRPADGTGSRPAERIALVLIATGLCLVVTSRAHDSVESLAAPLPQRVDAVGELVSDPEPQRFGTQFLVRVEGRRYQARVDPEAAGPVRDLLAGELVHLRGRPRPLRGAPPGWVRSRHLAGALVLDDVTSHPGARLWHRVGNGIHRTLSAGATPLGEDRAALYTGLVMGDDRAQSELMQFRFRAAGLTHLLAVSGQNVAFVLAVAAPLLRRAGPRTALLAALTLLATVVLVTRAEPSVLRAGAMAAFALVAVHRGRLASGVRLVALTVVVLLVVDPLLVHSVGFQLSVAATTGLLLLARPLAQRLPGPEWVSLPLAVTLSAQLATAPLLIGLNGGLPASATPANLLAVPAAGFVMMWGVSIGAVAGLVRPSVAQVLQVPVDWLVRWVEAVAGVATRAPLPVLGPTRLVLLCLVVAIAALAARRWPRGRDAARGVRPARRVVWLLVALGTLVALRPDAPPVGMSTPGAAARMWVGECGGTVVELDAAPDELDVLEGLWHVGIRRVDVVVVHGGSAAFRVAATLERQFDVRRTVTTGTRAPPGVEVLDGATLVVGGLVVRAPATVPPAPGVGRPEAASGLVRPSAAPCSV